MSEKDSERSFGELPTLGHEESRRAEPRSAAEGPSWTALGLSEVETLKPAEGIRDDGRTDAARRWKPGDVILDRYVVEGELGQGGMGVVYACLDRVGGVRVAVKCLPPELSHNSVEMEEVRENFRLVFGLNHQNIVSLKMLEKDGRGEYFLVMEVAEGESLRKWLRNKWRAGGVSPAEAAGVLKQVAAALDYAHGEKVVHRDVKPGNVVIDGRGRVKVLDFGLAAQIRTSLSRASHAYQGTSGTGPYMAPEQWRGRRQDGKTDQYALGVMAYEMLAGYLPFENEEVTVLREAVLREEPEDIPGLPEGTMAAIRRAMAKTATERFSTCSEFAEALEAGAGGGGAGKGSTSRPGVPKQGTADGAIGGRTAHPEGSPHQGSRAGERTTVRVGAQEVALRWCPAGTFTMGSPVGLFRGEAGRFGDETLHRVTLTRGFWMGETEVTQGLWREVMGENPSYYKSGDNYPVERVSWEDCQKFVQALNARHPQEGMRWTLPTEAQWEYACRAGATGPYAGTGKLDEMGWYSGNSGGQTHPVGQKEPNAWGLYDMHGNVWEWCADWYAADLGTRAVTDPQGPPTGSYRVNRGGSWSGNARGCRSAYRGGSDPGHRYIHLGLRVALLPDQ